MSGGRPPKAKGSAWEIECCRLLSKWVSGGHSDELLWRSAMSGGRATIRHGRGKGAQTVAGDICAIDPKGHELTDYYFIECKHIANMQILSFMLKGTGLLAGYWKTCVRQAVNHDRQPMLIAKQNAFPPVICLSTGHGLFEGAVCVIPASHCAIYPFAAILSRRYVIPGKEVGFP